MRVVQQGEAFAVQSQKSETGQVKKCSILLQELGGKYADQYACTMLGNAARRAPAAGCGISSPVPFRSSDSAQRRPRPAALLSCFLLP